MLVQQRVGDGARIYSCDPNDTAAIDLTPISGVSARLEKLSTEIPQQVLVGLNGRDPKVYDLWRVDITTGERELVIEGTGFGKIHVDANYRPCVAEKVEPDGRLGLFRRTEDGRWAPLRELDIDHSNLGRAAGAGVQGVVGVDRSGKVLYIVDNADRDKSALLAIEVASGEESLLASDPDADIRPAVAVDRVTGRALSATAQFDRLHRHYVDGSIRDDFALLERRFAGPVGVIGISTEDPAWLVVPFDGGPLRYHVYKRAAGTVEPLFSAIGALDGYPMAERCGLVATARDGLRLPCDLFLPPGADGDGDGLPDEPLPTLLFVHGGPHVAFPWDSWFTNRCLQLLANRGYASLRVEFRGAGGFGKSFLQKGWREWGGVMQRNLVDIARWAVDQQIAEKGHVGIWGWSFGGLSTFATLAFYPDEFACGVAMYGLSDLERFARRAELLSSGSSVALRVGDPRTEQGRELLRAQSPLHFAERVTSPLLVTHGGKDLVAPKQHSDLIVAALREHNKDVTYLIYPDEGHDYRQVESWRSFWAVAERFLHEHLGGRFEPLGNDLDESNMQVAAGGELIPGLSPPTAN